MSWPIALRCAAAVLAVAAAFPASAQILQIAQAPPPTVAPPVIPTPSELERQRRPELSSDPALVPRAPAPRRVGRPDQEITIDVTGYALPDSAPAALKAALPQLVAPYVGPGKSYADITNAALEVTRYLQSELGYYLGFAYIPEQKPAGGVIQIAVLEGRLDKVELVWKDGLPVDRDVVERMLAALKPGDVLLVQDVERVVFLVNDLRGIAAEFEVKPGSAPGTASLVVTPRALDQNSYYAEFDNTNARELGRFRLTGAYTRNSPFGRGDSATLTAIAGQGLAFALANYTTPVGGTGLRMGASAAMMKYKVVAGDFAALDMDGSATNLSAFALYPYLRSRNANLFIIGSIDGKNYDDSNGATSTEKRVTMGDIGVTADFRDGFMGGGITSVDSQLAHGRIRFDIAPAGAGNPDPNFTKFSIRAIRLQNLVPGTLQGYVAFRAQKAFDNLDVTEQFRVGGPDGVRAFTSGQGSGDSGASLTLELRYLLPEDMLASSIGGRATLSAFVDWATVERYHDTSGLTGAVINTERYGGAGFGLLWDGPDGMSARAGVAGQFEAPKDLAGNYRFDRSARFFVQLRKRF
ncbi:MAG: ShlB/FhaC/HecB family hemolysin secretion/activation protein [Burkholderiales bacterium]|nr:ShlB/FhaC/HecB family hemolysin secretion/activation protein [Burkholderiales bacterium]